MPRYISEEDFIQWVKEHYCTDCDNYNGVRCRACWIDDAIDLVEEAPTADVVPKREVARLQEDVDRLQEINNRQVENIKLAKAEVAREILGEVESLFYKTDFLDELGYIEFEIALAELKKKYTEGEKE